MTQIDQQHYLAAVYPNFSFEADDTHCVKKHYKHWFNKFMKDVFHKGNLIKHEWFLNRCIKTSPYHPKSGYNFAMLNRLAGMRSKERKNYEKDTVSSIAKIL